jgi:hypothetical protein
MGWNPIQNIADSFTDLSDFVMGGRDGRANAADRFFRNIAAANVNWASGGFDNLSKHIAPSYMGPNGFAAAQPPPVNNNNIYNGRYFNTNMDQYKAYDPNYRPDPSSQTTDPSMLTQMRVGGGSFGIPDFRILPTEISKGFNFDKARDIYSQYFQGLSNFYGPGGTMDSYGSNIMSQGGDKGTGSLQDLINRNGRAGYAQMVQNSMPTYDTAISAAQSAYAKLLEGFKARGDFGSDLADPSKFSKDQILGGL